MLSLDAINIPTTPSFLRVSQTDGLVCVPDSLYVVQSKPKEVRDYYWEILLVSGESLQVWSRMLVWLQWEQMLLNKCLDTYLSSPDLVRSPSGLVSLFHHTNQPTHQAFPSHTFTWHHHTYLMLSLLSANIVFYVGSMYRRIGDLLLSLATLADGSLLPLKSLCGSDPHPEMLFGSPVQHHPFQTQEHSFLSSLSGEPPHQVPPRPLPLGALSVGGCSSCPGASLLN